MAQVVNPQTNQVKLNSGATVNAQQGGWYDGQQYWGGSLSSPGVINSQSNQVGAGKAVSKEVVAQTNPNNVAYLAQQNPSLPYAPNGGQGTADTSSGNDAGGIGTGGSGAGVGIAPPATINLPGIYQSLSDQAGISDLEKSLTAKQTAYNDAQSKINDNPFLSEASRVGRVQKLTTDYNNDISSTQNELAMKKADIQTQLDLQTKQFDINSQVAQQGLAQFQTLLGSGALDNASGQDIANITRATGLSSSMIQSAVKAQQQKNVQTSVVQFDDGTHQGYAVINTQTGQVINKQVIGASKPSTSGNAAGTKLDLATSAIKDAEAAAKNGKTLDWMMANYPEYGLTDKQIYAVYKDANYYKPTAKQQTADQKRYGV